MKNPKVSVVIPAYNHEKYVGEAIQSVLDQTFQDLELIIINDGSTDNTETEILKFKDERIRYFSQENRGLSATLNRGIKLARGEFFNFLPSDDAFLREKLEIQLKVFKGNLDLGVVFAFPQLIDAQGKEIYNDPAALWPIVPHETKEEIFPALFERNFLSAPTALIRMDCLKKVGGFDESLKYAQDYDLWLRILKYYDARLLKQPLTRYRWHGKNLTFQSTPETESERAKILLKAFKDLSIEEIFLSLRKEQDQSAYARAYEKLASYVESSGIPAQIAVSQIYRELGRSLESSPLLLPSGREKRETKEAPFQIQERSSQKIHIVMETLTLDKGGLEQVIYNLAKGLSRDLFRIIIVVIEKGGLIAHQCKSMGIPVEILKYDKAREYQEVLERYQIDLVVSHYSTFGTKLAFEKGIPTLAVIHNIYSWLPDNVLSDFKSADPFISGYIAVSEEVKQYTHYRFNIPLERIAVIPNGIDVEEHTSRESSQTIHRSDLGLGDRDYVFINIASIVPNKGQNVILAALEKVVKEYPQIKVLSFGSILDEPYFQFLTEWIEKEHLSGHFKMVGFVEDVRPYFRIADAFLSTSFIEGWPLSVMEAMLYELPVIATQAGGVKEILDPDGNGIVLRNSYDDFRDLDVSGLDQLSRETSPRNAAEVAQAMKRFYEEKDYWKQRGKKGYERISKHFSLRGMVRSYERELFSLYIAMEKSRGYRRLRKIQEQEKLLHENKKSIEDLRSQLTQTQQGIDSKISLLESKTDSKYRNIESQLEYIVIRLSLKERLKGVIYRFLKRVHKLVPVFIREKYRKPKRKK
jgi:glycosyltransferase involved in cell wall biosynthesis/GT2 family glycosyltransferase